MVVAWYVSRVGGLGLDEILLFIAAVPLLGAWASLKNSIPTSQARKVLLLAGLAAVSVATVANMVVAWYVSRVGGLGLDEIPLPWIHTYHVLALLGGRYSPGGSTQFDCALPYEPTIPDCFEFPPR